MQCSSVIYNTIQIRSDSLDEAAAMYLVILIFVEILTLPLGRDPLLAREPFSFPSLQTLSFHAGIASLLTRFNALLPEELANDHVSTPIRLSAVLDYRSKPFNARLKLGFVLLCCAASVAIALPVAAVAIISSDTIFHPIAVFSRVENQTPSNSAISACPPSFLVVPLETLRQAPMHHESHILLVNTHTERRGSYYDIVARSTSDPFVLTFVALEVRESSMIGCSADLVFTQAGRKCSAVGAVWNIDYTGDGFRALIVSRAFFGYLLGAGGIVGATSIDFLEPRK